GVKPFHYASKNDCFLFASEIKALHAAGISKEPDEESWFTYLSTGVYDHSEKTFWKNILKLPAGHCLTVSAQSDIQIEKWYDLSLVLDQTDIRKKESV